jgi:hypothetical protein
MEDLALLICTAALLFGFFSALVGQLAGLAAGGCLTVLFGVAAGTSAEQVLKLAPTDFGSTAALLMIYGGGWLLGMGAKALADDV